ncbi:MAG: hypothetical protein ASARMPRED_001869 [Alectoria sarmentosa]|nr:MAG: hypothetical protein ASARMPRED_001869 [Alectoria sarmentosa]
MNPAIDQVRREVDEWLTRSVSDHSKLEKLKGGDYGLLGATFWPCASPERLRVATLLSIWLFIWDDEIDSDVGSLSADFDMAQKYRSDTLNSVQNYLGLDARGEAPTTIDNVIRSFQVIGDTLRDDCTIEQRRHLMDEIRFFVTKSEVEQRLRLNKHVTSLEDFWRYRLGSGAVRVLLCLNEYCNDVDLPAHVMRDENMRTLWDLTNINICSINDLFSAQGSTESLIPILYSELGSVQAAVGEVMTLIQYTIKELDVCAERLLQRFKYDSSVDLVGLQKFVDGCRLQTSRYGINQKLGQDEICIEL